MSLSSIISTPPTSSSPKASLSALKSELYHIKMCINMLIYAHITLT